MAFSSVIFVCVFLPLTVAMYYIIPKAQGKRILLTIAGLLFYAFGRLADMPVLLCSVVVHYAAGRLLRRLCRWRRGVVAAVVALDLGLLFFYKYLGFFLPFLAFKPQILPLGVSFFTFQGISYVVDAYRDREQASTKFWPVLQYLTFFPNLVSGPLQRFCDFRPQLERPNISAEALSGGLQRFVAGLGKKLLLAGTLGLAADAVFAMAPGDLDIRSAWLGALCYALQIFFDFSGYSDMAIGLAKLLGFTLPENFCAPYCADSITAFWRRWHISLSSWFRDYLYIPLGGNRRGKGRTVLNKIAVFLATGLWHGASWTFVLWGVWHGLFSILETVTSLRKRVERRWYGHVYALLVVILGFVLFRAGTVEQAAAIVMQMFTGIRLSTATTRLLETILTRKLITTFVVGCALSAAPVSRWDGNRWTLVRMGWSLILLALCLMALAGGSFQPFIYQQF